MPPMFELLEFMPPMLEFIPPLLALLEFMPPMFELLEFMPPMLEFEPLMLLVFVPVVVLPVLVVDELVVVVEFVVVMLALPFEFSVAQPVQKAATASRAKRAKVLRIEFSPVTLWVRLLRAVRG